MKFTKSKGQLFKDEEDNIEFFAKQFGGEYCPYLIDKTKPGKQFSAYVLILKDIDHSIECFTTLNEGTIEEMVLIRSLFESGIHTYMKCFNSNDVRGTSIEKKDIFKNDENECGEFHDRLAEFRHNYLAHSSSEEHESGSTVIHLNPNEEDPKVVNFTVSARYSTNDFENYTKYIDMFNFVRKQVEEKIDKVTNHLKKVYLSDEVLEFYKKAKRINPDKIKIQERGNFVKPK